MKAPDGRPPDERNQPKAAVTPVTVTLTTCTEGSARPNRPPRSESSIVDVASGRYGLRRKIHLGYISKR